MTPAQYRIQLETFIFMKYKTKRAASEAWDVSPTTVTKVVKGDLKPTFAMLRDTGHTSSTRTVTTITKVKL